MRRPGIAVKRGVDVVLGVIGLLLAGPLILVLALLVWIDSRGPALFVQERLARAGKRFRMYKLRTMVQDAAAQGAGLAIEADDPRITRLGKLLRATSLDELPQLWNVLRGDMSFVGPRPLPVAYLERWSERQRKRLLMPQGITGWSQLIARNDAPWPERLELDVWYVENWSLWLDLRIFFATIWGVLARRGISASDGSVQEFMGSERSSTLRTRDHE